MNRSRMILLALAATLALPAGAQAAKPQQQLYVSLGDSYASGFQPTAQGKGANTRNGFAYQVPKLAAARGYRFKLVNFGCGGATTESLLERKDCDPRALGPGGKPYAGRTQIAAAERFLRRHRGKVGLITVSIGGNDVTQVRARREPDPVRGRRRDGDQRERHQDRRSGCASRGRPEGADRRHHLSGRDPRPVGRREREPGSRAALGRRVQGPHQPGAHQGLRGRGRHARRRDGRHRRVRPARRPGRDAVGHARPQGRSPTSASSPTTASSATSTRARAATA